MSVYTLLADATTVLERINPLLAELEWTVADGKATANIAGLTKMGTVPSEQHPGSWTLVILEGPEALPIVNALHDEHGWKRGSTYAVGCPGWEIYAYLREGDAEVRLIGYAAKREDGVNNDAIPFFAPEPPTLSRRKGFVADHREWERKCFQDEW
jgi:hypothetical protein